MIRRILGKVSGDNPLEELVKFIAHISGLDPSQIHLPPEMEDTFKKFADEQKDIKKVIEPFYSRLKALNTKDSNKKASELVDLGKFICFLNNGIEILECTEGPDFIVKFQDKRIGIEHTGIFDKQVVAEIRRFKKILEKCQKLLAQSKSEISGGYNLLVNPQILQAKLPKKEAEVVQLISDYIVAHHSKSNFEKPDFISEVITSESPNLELRLSEDYWLATLCPEALKHQILEKSIKVGDYKSPKNLEECWLLMVIDGASSISSFTPKFDRIPVELTLFDKIFIFNNFSGSVFKAEKN